MLMATMAITIMNIHQRVTEVEQKKDFNFHTRAICIGLF